ncbi:MAG TPA: DUF1802 family protein [Armatimonadota bacterium]
MNPTNDKAFKEWAVVVRALEAGESMLLIRKGGVVEEGGALRLSDPEFFFFPNHTHQSGDQLQPRAHGFLAESEAERPEEGTVRISSFAEVLRVWIVTDEATLASLESEHVWTTECVTERFRYKPTDPLFAIALRVYRLPEPVQLPYLSAYRGCTSWVTLDAPLSTEGAIPVIDDAACMARLSALSALLDKI